MKKLALAILALSAMTLGIWSPKFAYAKSDRESAPSTIPYQRELRITYNESMAKYFQAIENLSKKHTRADDFAIAIMGLPADHPDVAFLRETLKDQRTPTVLSSKNGLEVSQNNRKFRLALGQNLGEIEMDGKPFVVDSSKTLREQMDELSKKKSKGASVIDLFLPQAQAIAPVVGLALRGLGTVGWNSLKFGFGGTVAGAAGGAVAGLTSGCMIGVSVRADDQTAVEGCREGANSAIFATTFGSAVGTGLGIVGLGAVGRFGDLPPEQKSAVGKVFKGAGILGLLALAYQGVDFVRKLDGARVSCQWQGRYEIKGLSGGAVVGTLYRFSHTNDSVPNFVFNTRLPVPATIEGLKAHLKASGKMMDHEIKAVSDRVMAEHRSHVEFCLANPGKDRALVDSAAKKLKPLPAAN